jgi:phospholipid/cholesterol/gamma-HCH transport system substrate-binding protein
MKKYAMETMVGIFLVFGLICIAYMTVKLGHASFLGDNSYPLFARFTSVSGLKVGSPVDMFGLRVGRVDGLAMDQENQKAVVKMRIQKGTKIFDDAFASIKTEGLIGDKYLSIDPGGAQPAVDVSELISKYAFGDLKKLEGSNKDQGEKP